MAHTDWPEEWPDLMTQLLGLLGGENPNSVHGALRVLVEFVKSNVTEDQLLPIAKDMLPQLLNILGSPEVRVLLLHHMHSLPS